jgi:hypothetical protein
MVVKKTISAEKKEKGTTIAKAVRKPSRKISSAQKFQLKVIARTNFNFCNGRRIAELLKENKKMWCSVLMPLDFISLRDMEENCWHADTLYIYAEEGYQYPLEELVREQFNANEVHWIGSSGAADMLGDSSISLENKSQMILSVWWD